MKHWNELIFFVVICYTVPDENTLNSSTGAHPFPDRGARAPLRPPVAPPLFFHNFGLILKGLEGAAVKFFKY